MIISEQDWIGLLRPRIPYKLGQKDISKAHASKETPCVFCHEINESTYLLHIHRLSAGCLHYGHARHEHVARQWPQMSHPLSHWYSSSSSCFLSFCEIKENLQITPPTLSWCLQISPLRNQIFFSKLYSRYFEQRVVLPPKPAGCVFLKWYCKSGKNYLVLNVRMKSKGQASVEGVICGFCFIDQANVEGVNWSFANTSQTARPWKKNSTKGIWWSLPFFIKSKQPTSWFKKFPNPYRVSEGIFFNLSLKFASTESWIQNLKS